MLSETENGGALLRFVAADALEDRRAIAHDVGEDMKGGVVPVDPLSVVPDFVGLLDGHEVVLLVAPLAALPESAEYGTRRGASIKCTERRGQYKNQFGA